MEKALAQKNAFAISWGDLTSVMVGPTYTALRSNTADGAEEDFIILDTPPTWPGVMMQRRIVADLRDVVFVKMLQPKYDELLPAVRRELAGKSEDDISAETQRRAEEWFTATLPSNEKFVRDAMADALEGYAWLPNVVANQPWLFEKKPQEKHVSMRTPMLLAAFVCAVGSALFAMSAAAAGTKDIMPKPTERQQQVIDVLEQLNLANAPTREQFVAGSTAFAVYHELGHFLIDEYDDIPILGRGTEDMADTYATFELAPYTPSEHMQSAVRLWLYLAFDKGTTPIAWWDEHSLDHQRAFDVACVLAGRWPQRYAGLPEAFGASSQRDASCARDAPRRQSSWVRTLRAQNAALIDRQKAVVTYFPALAELADTERWLRANGLLEAVATEIQRYKLPEWRIQWREKLDKDMAEGRLSVNAFESTRQQVDVMAKGCGVANAFYRPVTDKPAVPGVLPTGTRPQRPRLVLCYELIDKFRSLAVEAGLAEK